MTTPVVAPPLRRSVAWTLAGNVVFAACQWGVLSALTKLGTPEDTGRFALASAIATPILMFSNLQLNAVMVADAEERRPFGEYLGLRLLLGPAALLVTAAVALIGYSGDQVPAIVMFGVGRWVEGLSDIHYAYDQKRERLDVVARSFVLRGLASLALFAGTYAATGSLVLALAGQAAGWLAVLALFDVPRARALFPPEAGPAPWRPSFRAAGLRELAVTALPLGATMFLIQLRNTVPRSLLEASHGEEALGFFVTMAYLILLGNTAVMAVSQSSLARLARARAAGDRRSFGRVVRTMLLGGAGVGAAGVLAAALWGRPLLTWLYRPEYAQNTDVFVVVMLGGALTYLGGLLGAPATASQAFRSQLVVQGVNVGILMALGSALIPRWGMMGAAWTIVAGAAWTAAAYGVIVLRALRGMAGREAAA
ncbi:MAG TPA: lipopolysaccharide biosynthesis protein [Candidatus Krumholzibacteria bacterium]|nr:lipopolysaccharide biosynthesis protein [Candidatus Krumholzibacteria bacterium]HRX52463.1 lipopolysaccharide biosynthesis protein [Candidatus Krumholzibacteria bacterium]